MVPESESAGALTELVRVLLGSPLTAPLEAPLELVVRLRLTGAGACACGVCAGCRVVWDPSGDEAAAAERELELEGVEVGPGLEDSHIRSYEEIPTGNILTDPNECS